MKLNQNIAWAKNFYKVYKPFKQIFVSNAEKSFKHLHFPWEHTEK